MNKDRPSAPLDFFICNVELLCLIDNISLLFQQRLSVIGVIIQGEPRVTIASFSSNLNRQARHLSLTSSRLPISNSSGVNVPVVGGHASITILPLFSQEPRSPDPGLISDSQLEYSIHGVPAFVTTVYSENVVLLHSILN
ncbi:hypothetical protein BVRB_9g222480 [Beta vulgaris subsp. vulgaris]|nr:hypothetical protein BVRB_9g222480 [Beta vulgaris subsp. vulgaris]